MDSNKYLVILGILFYFCTCPFQVLICSGSKSFDLVCHMRLVGYLCFGFMSGESYIGILVLMWFIGLDYEIMHFGSMCMLHLVVV